MALSTFLRITWPADAAINTLLLVVLFVRRRVKDFPVLTIYFGFSLGKSLANVFTFFYLPTKSMAIASGENLVGCLLFVGVFYELATHVFCPTGVWARDVRRTFTLLMAGGVLLALVLSSLSHPAAQTQFDSFMLHAYFFTSLLLSELFVGTVVLSATVGLPWKTHTARVARGLGIYCIVCLALNIVSSSVGLLANPQIYVQLQRFNVVNWIVCEVYLIVVLWQEAPVPRELPEQMRAQIYRLNQQLEAELVRVRSWKRS